MISPIKRKSLVRKSAGARIANSSRLIIALLVLSLCASFSLADYYVGKSGCSDSGQGTSSSPFCTIQKAANTAKAGNTVYVKAGTYKENVELKNSGTSSAYITFRPYNSDTVNLDPGLFAGNGVSYIKLIGFHIKNSPSPKPAIRFYGTGGFIEVRDNEVTGTQNTASGAVEFGDYMHDFIIDNNHVHHCSTGNAEAIKVFQHTANFKITNNLVEYNTNIGIVVNGWAKWGKPKNGQIKGNTVRYNSIKAPYSAGIYLDCTSGMVVENNVAYGNVRGLQVGCEEPGDISENNIMRNNVAYKNTGSGIQVGGYQDGITKNNDIYNNVFYENGMDELGFDSTPGSGNEFYNNIFYDPGTNLIWGQGSQNVFDHNVYFDDAGPGSSNIIKDPMFVDASKNDFKLKTGSPACTAGRNGGYIGAFACTSTAAVCGDGSCNGKENCTTCSKDCGVCPVKAPVCGDGSCNGKENCTTCSKDCGVCPVKAPVCGDGSCNGKENCTTCSKDCGVCPVKAPVCGDGSCNGQETCSSCSKDCGTCAPFCGDLMCNNGETCSSCSKDCGVCAPVCGDGTCNGKENCTTCSKDCGSCPTKTPVCGDGACNGQESCSSCSKDCGSCEPACGDGSCNGGESCSSCSEDCGECRSSGGGSSGGGHSSGGSAPACIEQWACTSWTDCAVNLTTRICTDANACGTTKDKPGDIMDCIEEIPEENLTPAESTEDFQSNAVPEEPIVESPAVQDEIPVPEVPEKDHRGLVFAVIAILVAVGISAYFYLKPDSEPFPVSDAYSDIKQLIKVARHNGYDDHYIKSFLTKHGLEDDVVRSLVSEISVVNVHRKQSSIAEWHSYIIENLKQGVSLEDIEAHLLKFGINKPVVDYILKDFRKSYGLSG